MIFSSSLFWLLGFLCGSFLGMLTDAFVISWQIETTLPFLFFSFFLPLSKKKKILTMLCAGFIWGASHSAPSSQSDLDHVQVIQKNLIPFGSGMLVKNVESLGYFYATGIGKNHEYGSTLYYPKTSIYPPDRNQFKEHFPEKNKERTFLSLLVINLERRISVVSPEIQGFIYSVFMGDKHHLGSQLLNAFKKLGLFHLLVVSGLHLSFLSAIILALVFFPFQLAYSLCLINPRLWYYLRFCLQIVSTMIVSLYAVAIGFPPSVQRAVLLFSSDQFVKIFAISIPIKERIASTLVLQSVFFALDFLSIGSLLSWTSYLTVYAFANCETKTWREVLLCQMTLCLFMGAILGQVSVVGFFLNIVVVPIFPFVVFWIFPLVVGELFPKGFSVTGELIQSLFLRAMKFLGSKIEDIPFLYFEISQFMVLRGILLALAFACLILLLKNSSSRMAPSSRACRGISD